MIAGIISTIIVIGLIVLIGFIVLIVFVARKANRGREISKESGDWGEQEVADLLKKCALEGDKIISNLIVRNPKTEMTTEIDHILISVRGFFVIEVKNYSGTIYGEESEKTWRQVMGRGTMTMNSFYSPIKQNETHIFNLKQILHTHVYMENIVIFVQGNTENIKYKNIYTPDEFEEYLNQIKTQQLSEQKRDELYDALVKLQEMSVSKEEHVQNIREQQWKIEHNICPRCGKGLVLRKGPYGEFYACTGYPNCTFKKQIPKE